jgi:hypothetical protein
MKAYWGSGYVAPHILDLGTEWRWVVSFVTRPLYLQGKSPWYPSGRRLGWPQSRSGHGAEEKNSQPLQGLEPPAIQPVAQCYTTVSRLLIIFSEEYKLWSSSLSTFLRAPVTSASIRFRFPLKHFVKWPELQAELLLHRLPRIRTLVVTVPLCNTSSWRGA